jgi:hypothetical protein
MPAGRGFRRHRPDLQGKRPPFPISDAVQTTPFIDAIYKSGDSGKWEAV